MQGHQLTSVSWETSAGRVCLYYAEYPLADLHEQTQRWWEWTGILFPSSLSYQVSSKRSFPSGLLRRGTTQLQTLLSFASNRRSKDSRWSTTSLLTASALLETVWQLVLWWAHQEPRVVKHLFVSMVNIPSMANFNVIISGFQISWKYNSGVS